MIEERARAALRVFDEELAASLHPDFRVGSANNLALERKLVRSQGVGGGDAEPRAISEASNTQRGLSLADVAADGIKPEGTARVDVGDEANAVGGAVGLGGLLAAGKGGHGGACDDGNSGGNLGCCRGECAC